MVILFSLVLLAADPVAERVVEYARSQVGQKVGDGECSALARSALDHAGAKRGTRGTWGEAVPSLKDARPGDVLQFENAVFVHKRTRPDGAIVTLTYQYPHHTAIVSGVRKRGRRIALAILHQNAGAAGGDDTERKVVQEWVIDLAELRGGTVKAYRPVAE